LIENVCATQQHSVRCTYTHLRLLRLQTTLTLPCPPHHVIPQEFDANYDGRITFDEFNTALGRWVDEKLTSSSAAAGGGNGFAGRYSALLDPRHGGPNASLLEDLPPDDLAQLQVRRSLHLRRQTTPSVPSAV
jgi:hypothetical protein